MPETLGDFGILGGNQIELLVEYDGSVDRLVTDINAATQHVHLLYYISVITVQDGMSPTPLSRLLPAVSNAGC